MKIPPRSRLHASLTNIRPVLIRHPKRAVGIDDQALAIDGDPAPAGPVAAEPVARVGGDGQVGKAGVRQVARHVGVEAGARLAVGAREADRVVVRQDQVRGRRVARRGVGRRRQRDGELVDARLEVQRAFRVPVPGDVSMWSWKITPLCIFRKYLSPPFYSWKSSNKPIQEKFPSRSARDPKDRKHK